MRRLPTFLRATALVLLIAESAEAAGCLGLVAQRAERDSRITVTAQDGSRLSGTYAGIRDSKLLLADPDSVHVLDGAELRSIEFRDRSRPVFLYAISGFVLGVVLGAKTEDRVGLGNLGAVAKGGAIGLLVGLVFPLKIPYTRRVECE